MAKLADTIYLYININNSYKLRQPNWQEAVDLGSTQCGFESRPEYQTSNKKLKSHGQRVISLKLLNVYLYIKEIELYIDMTGMLAQKQPSSKESEKEYSSCNCCKDSFLSKHESSLPYGIYNCSMFRVRGVPCSLNQIQKKFLEQLTEQRCMIPSDRLA